MSSRLSTVEMVLRSGFIEENAPFFGKAMEVFADAGRGMKPDSLSDLAEGRAVSVAQHIVGNKRYDLVASLFGGGFLKPHGYSSFRSTTSVQVSDCCSPHCARKDICLPTRLLPQQPYLVPVALSSCARGGRGPNVQNSVDLIPAAVLPVYDARSHPAGIIERDVNAHINLDGLGALTTRSPPKGMRK